MMDFGRWIGTGVLGLMLGAAGAMAQTPANPMTAYISTADNQWALWLPMDSAQSVTLAIDTLAKDFHTKRLWWRGGQDDLLFANSYMRPDNRFYYAMTDWVTGCDKTVNPAAMKAARRNGMKIDFVYGIYEFFDQAAAGGCVQFPYQGEDKLRIEHPQWVPVNKYGTRVQGGPLEFGYPEARDAVCKRLVDFAVEKGYDGVALYTYNENFSLRYPDEFGYNDPVVKDFKNKYGVDIRTQAFDHAAWAKLRGSYLTELFRQLHAGLARHGKKLIVWLSATDDHQPMTWNSGGKVRTAGDIHMDWETWVKEGIVDELCVYWPGNAEELGRVMKACQGTNVKVSMFQTMGELPKGVGRVFMPSGSAEAGYPYEAAVGYQGEKTPVPSDAALKRKDPHARRQWLYLVEKGTVKATVAQVEAMLKDHDLYVKRAALRALGKMKAKSSIPAIEAMLTDPQNCVKCQAAVVLGDLGEARSIGPIFDAVANHGTFQFDEVAALGALHDLAPKDIDAVVARMGDSNPTVRRIAFSVMQGMRYGNYPQAKAALLKAAAGDDDPWNRELALGALVRYRGDQQVIAAMEKAMTSDADQTVQSRAAVYLAWLVDTSKAMPFNPGPDEKSPARLDEPEPFGLASADSAEGKQQRRVLGLLVNFFRQYGTGCERSDKDWGWRAVGNAIMAFNVEGKAALQAMIDHPTDKQLADRAWRVVWIPQKVMAYVPATAEEDAVANAHRPK